MWKKHLFIVIFILCFSMTVNSKTVDKIVAVVDSDIILYSEFISQYQLLASQRAFKEMSPTEIDSAKMEILNKMVDDKLLLALAREDTTISITKDEIDKALEKHIKDVRSKFPSEESFKQQLKAEGLTLKDLRIKYRDEVANQLLKDRFLNKELSQTTVNNQEVKDFYNTYKDSLPERPASVKLAHILISIKPGEETLNEKKRLADSLHTELLNGAEFSQLAKEYSDDPTATRGGDLGFFGRGDMVPEFEKAAYSLVSGQISKVVKTDFGYHIIKCTDRDGEQIRCSHILISTIPTSTDTSRAMAKADSIYQMAVSGTPFEELAKKYSDDEDSRVFGGELGWYAADELSSDFKKAVGDKKAGTIIPPIVSSSGIHIIKILDRQPKRPVNLKLDWDELKEMARRQKANDKLQEMIREARKTYFVQIRNID